MRTIIRFAAPVVAAVTLGAALAAPAPAAARPTRYVAITFDDGPVARTNQALDVLAARGVRATFFIKADEIAGHRRAFARLLAQGHAVGNHTYSHPNLVDVLATGGVAAVRAEIAGAQSAITDAGAPTPVLFRPPFGATNPTINAVVEEFGMRVVIWNATVEQDYTAPVPGAAATICTGILSQATAGGVILLHDWNINTINALPCIIDGLRAKGLEPGRIVPANRILPGVGAVRVVPWT
jgi:peptidoglycan/xylan/chitin deacetylase (PgdA/CDA1 family)